MSGFDGRDELERLLDAAGARERQETLAEAERLDDAPGQEAARRTIEREASRAPRTLRTVALVAAAAVLVTVTVWLAGRSASPSGGGDAPYFIGEGGVEIVRPTRASEPFAPIDPGGALAPGVGRRAFAWSSPRDPGDVFELRVFDDAAGPGAEPVLVVRELEETTWSPTEEECLRLPARFRWEVRRLSPTGEVIGSAAAEGVPAR